MGHDVEQSHGRFLDAVLGFDKLAPSLEVNAPAVKFHYAPPKLARQAFPGSSREFDLIGSDDQDHIVRTIAGTHTFYEEELLLHLALRGPRGGIVVDAGANIGNHSVYFAAYLADHLLAFEPMAEVASVCRRNLETNGLGNFELCELALGAKPGRGRLEVPDQGNLGQTRFVPVEDDVAGSLEQTTLDLVYDRVRGEKPDLAWNLVKIDVEGMQLAVLQGATRLLAAERPQIVVEAETVESAKELDDLLIPLGYQKIGRFCDTPTFHYLHPSRHQLGPLPFAYRVSRHLRKWLGLK